MRQLGPAGNAGDGTRRWLLIWVALIILVVVPWLSFERHAEWERVKWIPFLSPPVNFDDLVANVLLYIPFGFWALRLSRTPRPGLVVGCAFVLSLVTELTQVYSHGRFPSTTDLTCNVYGAWLGTWHRKPGG